MLSMSIRENLELSVSLPARDGQIPQMLGHCAQHLGTQISTVLRPPSPHQCTRQVAYFRGQGSPVKSARCLFSQSSQAKNGLHILQ